MVTFVASWWRTSQNPLVCRSKRPDQGEGGRLWRSEICVGCRWKVFLGLHRSVKPSNLAEVDWNASILHSPFCFWICVWCVFWVQWNGKFMVAFCFSKAEKTLGKRGGGMSSNSMLDALQKIPRQRAFEEMDLGGEKYHVTLVKIGWQVDGGLEKTIYTVLLRCKLKGKRSHPIYLSDRDFWKWNDLVK